MKAILAYSVALICLALIFIVLFVLFPVCSVKFLYDIYNKHVVIIAEEAAECRLGSDAELLKLCTDAGRRSECLRCLRKRIARHLANRV